VWLFRVLVFAVLFFTLGGSFGFTNLFWRDDPEASNLWIVAVACLLASPGPFVYIWYRVAAGKTESAWNSTLNKEITALKQQVSALQKTKRDHRKRMQATATRMAQSNEDRYGLYAKQSLFLVLVVAVAFGGSCGFVFRHWLPGTIVCGVVGMGLMLVWAIKRGMISEELKWIDRWEQCPECRRHGAGQLLLVNQLSSTTVNSTRVVTDSVYQSNDDGLGMHKTGEIHRTIPFSYQVGKHVYIYQCRLCGHKWSKIASTEEMLPRYLVETVIPHMQHQVTESEQRIKQLLDAQLNQRPSDQTGQ